MRGSEALSVSCMHSRRARAVARPLRVIKGVQYIFSSFITSVPDCISVQEMQEDTWEWWNGLRTLCGNSKKLAVRTYDSD